MIIPKKSKTILNRKKHEKIISGSQISHFWLESGNEKIVNPVIDAGKAMVIIDLIEYKTNSVLSNTIIKKTTGNVSVLSFDSGKELKEKVSPFDVFVQIIDGIAEFVIDGKSIMLETGQSIIVPAHTSNVIKATERFKMITTIIKSGYE
jgi:quercetin dioxygenase-like cupin family protein